MDITCSDCGVNGVQSDEATFNIVYVCPECDEQLACTVAKE